MTGAFARDIALAAVVLGALSGVALAACFEADALYRSISSWLLAHPVAVFTRNVHYWAAQIGVAAALWYAWTRLRSAPAAWRAAFVFASGALLLSGFALRGDPPAGVDASGPRKLDDGRYFERVTADVHHERGLECIDCHTSNELMGSGALVARKTDQLRVGCVDCHAAKLASIDPAALDPESRTLLALRKWTLAPSQRLGATRDGEPLVNVVVDEAGRGRLRRKRSGEWLPLKAPLTVCTQGRGHARLSCVSCHSAWAPRCTTCHTRIDPNEEGYDYADRKWVRGTWNESSGPFDVAPPTLGIRIHRDAGGREHGVVETFVPGSAAVRAAPCRSGRSAGRATSVQPRPTSTDRCERPFRASARRAPG